MNYFELIILFSNPTNSYRKQRNYVYRKKVDYPIKLPLPLKREQSRFYCIACSVNMGTVSCYFRESRKVSMIPEWYRATW